MRLLFSCQFLEEVQYIMYMCLEINAILMTINCTKCSTSIDNNYYGLCNYLQHCLPIHLELPVGLGREWYVGEVTNEVIGVSASQEKLTTNFGVLVPVQE